MRVPARIGEGNSGLSKGNTSEKGVALKEVLNQIASDLGTSATSLTALKALVAAAADFGAFKTAVASWSVPAAADVLQQSTDA